MNEVATVVIRNAELQELVLDLKANEFLIKAQIFVASNSGCRPHIPITILKHYIEMTNGGRVSEHTRVQWDGDVLSRKAIGDFLYRLLTRKYEISGAIEDAGSICFALDGDWGCGKSFFITRWAKDIENCEHPVIVFDAWKNDLSQDPLMGFIAALQSGLKRWTRKVAVGPRLKEKATSLGNDAFRKAGRAIVPISLLLAKGMIKKLSGTSLDDISDLLREEDATAGHNENGDQRNENRGKLLDDAIDEYLNASLEEHSRHIRAIDDFKNAARNLLAYLESNVKARLPVFIIIDELDRCRPDYAIQLLEGIKHLFDVRGFCFCISTNQIQLCESIKGIYGSGFDSRKYLKRFFSFEYMLPTPTDHAFARLLVPNSIIAAHGKIVSGLSDWHSTKSGENESIARSFHFVAEAFHLTLRSQRQVFEIADAACSGIDRRNPVHLLYLFGLAALWHLDRDALMNLRVKSKQEEATRRLDSLTDSAITHSYVFTVPSESIFRTERKKSQKSFSDLFKAYLQLANNDLKDIRDAYHRSTSIHEYPKDLEQPLVDEMPSAFSPQQAYPPSIRSYIDLVRTAGQMADTEL